MCLGGEIGAPHNNAHAPPVLRQPASASELTSPPRSNSSRLGCERRSLTDLPIVMLFCLFPVSPLDQMQHVFYCTHCGYPLHSAICTECGSLRDPTDPLNYDASTQARKSWRLAFKYTPLFIPAAVISALLFFLPSHPFISTLGAALSVLLLGLLLLRFVAIPLAYQLPYRSSRDTI